MESQVIFSPFFADFVGFIPSGNGRFQSQAFVKFPKLTIKRILKTFALPTVRQ